jgi:hypothetical protein
VESGDVTQVLEHLLYKNEALGTSPGLTKKKKKRKEKKTATLK